MLTKCNCCQNEYQYSFETNWNVTLKDMTICPLCLTVQKEFFHGQQEKRQKEQEEPTVIKNIKLAWETMEELYEGLPGAKPIRRKRNWKQEQRAKRTRQWDHIKV